MLDCFLLAGYALACLFYVGLFFIGRIRTGLFVLCWIFFLLAGYALDFFNVGLFFIGRICTGLFVLCWIVFYWPDTHWIVCFMLDCFLLARYALDC